MLTELLFILIFATELSDLFVWAVVRHRNISPSRAEFVGHVPRVFHLGRINYNTYLIVSNFNPIRDSSRLQILMPEGIRIMERVFSRLKISRVGNAHQLP